MINRSPLFLLDIELTSGTERASDRPVNTPTVTYEPFVISWGVFESSIPAPPGMPIVSDGKFKITEPEAVRKWRDLFSHQTPRRRKVKLWTLFEGESLSMRVPGMSPSASPPDGEERTPFFTGEIVDAVFNPDRTIDITCRDTTYAWLDEPIPAMITKDIYPGLLDRYEGQFLPIVAGKVRTPDNEDAPSVTMTSPPSAPRPLLRGQIELPRMGWNDETGDRWGVAAHPCARVVIFRKEEIVVDGDQTETWYRVHPGEYTERIIPKTAFNLSMNHHVIDFFVEQPDGTEIRADIDGIDYRGPWGSLTEVGTPLASPPAGTMSPPDEALEDVIDFFINMTFFVMNKAGVSGGDGSVWDLDDIAAVRTKLQSLGLKVRGAITEPMTVREWMTQYFTSFPLDMWQKRSGKISLNFTDEANPDRPVYTETSHILKNTFTERLPEKPINQYQYRYLYNSAEKTWGTWGLLDTSEQEALAVGEIPKVEKEVLDLFWVGDPDTARIVTQHRAQFQSLGSYQQEWQLPLPEVPLSLEPSSLVGVTHRMGLEIGGYINREVKVLKLRHDLDKRVTTAYGILREPQPIQPTFTGETSFEMLDYGIGTGGSPARFGKSIHYLPVEGEDTQHVEYYIEVDIENNDAVPREVKVYPVLEFSDPWVVGTPQSLTVTPGLNGRYRSTTPFMPDPASNYYIVETPATGATSWIWRCRIIAMHDGAIKFTSDICMSSANGGSQIDQSIGAGDIIRTTSNGTTGNSTGFVDTGGPRFKYVAAAWDTVTQFGLMVILANANFSAGNWSEGALWDVTDNALVVRVVAASDSMFLNPQPFRSVFPKTLLTDGHVYAIYFRSVKNEDGDFNTYFHKGRLTPYITMVKAFEVHNRIGNAAGVSEVRGFFEGHMEPVPDCLFEFHGTAGDRRTISDYGTADTGTSGTAISQSEEAIPAGNDKFVRSRDLSDLLIPGHRYAAGNVLQGSIVSRYPRRALVVPFTPASDRQQFLYDMYVDGYPAAFAVTFEEGTGAPKEFFSNASLSLSGSPSWNLNGTYGQSGRASATTDYWIIDNVGPLVPTDVGTVIVVRKKADTTARNATLCGITTDFFARWMSLNAPLSDNSVRFICNFEYSITGLYTPSTNLELWIARYGPNGRLVIKDGAILGSTSTTGNRTASNLTDDFAINFASGNWPAGDIQDIFFTAFFRAEIPVSKLTALSVDRILLGA